MPQTGISVLQDLVSVSVNTGRQEKHSISLFRTKSCNAKISPRALRGFGLLQTIPTLGLLLCSFLPLEQEDEPVGVWDNSHLLLEFVCLFLCAQGCCASAAERRAWRFLVLRK